MVVNESEALKHMLIIIIMKMSLFWIFWDLYCLSCRYVLVGVV